MFDLHPIHLRMSWVDFNPKENGDHITPMRVSRAVSDTDLVDKFWIDVLKSKEVFKVEIHQQS